MNIDPIVLNEEIPNNKYESYSNSSNARTDTLEEPVIETFVSASDKQKRDFRQIYDKIRITLSGNGDYDKIRHEWDLWGPLVISLVTASMGAFGTSGEIDEASTNLFIGMWLGPLVITINANLLGADMAIMQTLCLIIYCSTPIMLLSIVVFIMNEFVHWFLLNLLLSLGALYFVFRTNRGLFESFISGDRKLLALYPVLLFYTFMCIFIAMT